VSAVPQFADISRLVRPNRVAVVGASDRAGSFGRSTYVNVRDNSTVPGGTFPVNPAYQTVLGDQAYPTVSAIPGDPVDVAIVLVSAELVLDVVKDCANHGVRHLMVLSSGFSETDDTGVDRQRQMVELARAAGMRIYGPNSPGLSNNADQVLLTMSPVAGDDVSIGPVGLVTQGGGLGRAIMQWRDRGLGIGLWASPGNEADLDVSDFVNHMIDDERIRVIGGVVEGFSDGAKFIEAARRAQAAGKPVVVLKIGRSEYGQKTAASHTASIAGNDAVADAVFSQYGVVRVDDVDELAETMLLFCRALEGNIDRIGDVCVYSFSGGTASLGADMIGAAGLRLAEFTAETAAALQERAPSFGFVDNPIDPRVHRFRAQPGGVRAGLRGSERRLDPVRDAGRLRREHGVGHDRRASHRRAPGHRADSGVDVTQARRWLRRAGGGGFRALRRAEAGCDRAGPGRRLGPDEGLGAGG
jgi:acyl-CoA synthetase (NDP forming)